MSCAYIREFNLAMAKGRRDNFDGSRSESGIRMLHCCRSVQACNQFIDQSLTLMA
jgi:hypothetical protein